MTSLKQVLGQEGRFVVPTYQRDYEWTRDDQWALLADDVEQRADLLCDARTKADAAGGTSAPEEAEVGPHFLGAIVLEQVPSRTGAIGVRAVIDGQQRLTTVQLMVRGILDAVVVIDAFRAKQLESLLLNPEYSASGDERYKVWPRRRDRDAWRVAMATECHMGSQHVYLEARRYFAQRARAFIGETQDQKRCSALVDALRDLLHVVTIDLGKTDDAQVIFEALNGRQMKLFAADLVKNLLFLRLEQVKPGYLDAVYDQYWSHFDDPWWKKEVGRGHAARRHSDMLLTDWLTAVTGKEVQSGRLYGEIRSHLSSRTDVESVIREIHDYAREYQIIKNELADVDPRVCRAYDRLVVVGLTTADPLLLWLRVQVQNGLLTPADHRRAVVMIESFVLRRLIVGSQTRSYGQAFVLVLSNVRKLVAAKSAGIADLLEAELRHRPNGYQWPTEDEVVAACRNRRFYGADPGARLQLLLGSIDEHVRASNPKTEHMHLDYMKLTIEHVMPRAWEKFWPVGGATAADRDAAAEHRRTFVDRLGNLTLVTGTLNPSMSNGPWSHKREELAKNSLLALNAAIANQDNWDEESILRRSEDLAHAACHVWPRPAVQSPAELGGAGDWTVTSAGLVYDWGRVDAAVAAIPRGSWTTYGEVAKLGGTAPQAVGNRLAAGGVPLAYRVLAKTGTVSPNFQWADPDDHRDVRELLEEERILFDADGRADRTQRMSAYRLAQMIPARFSQEELDVLAAADTVPVPKRVGGSESWKVDGRTWHLNECSPTTRGILEGLERLITEALPSAEASWAQNRYVSWRVGPGMWLAATPMRECIHFQIRSATVSPQQIADRLHATWNAREDRSHTKADGPIEVCKGSRWALRITLKSIDHVDGEAGQRLRQLLQEEASAEPWVTAPTELSDGAYPD